MDRGAERLIFNTREPSDAALKGGHVVAIPSDDPVIMLVLDADAAATKVERQARRLRQLAASAQNGDPFGPALDWAYRCYRVVRLSDTDVFRDHLYLFNLLVALEWQPDQAYLEQLKTAFRRASDFLFDVTDGWMALGQVVFGGPELMAAADIQVMASTRMHPRSWVGAMHSYGQYHSDEKYMPIRLGRGLWNDNRRGVIPWDEPEGYRIIAHEWGHHALKLTDEYLETRQVLLPSSSGAAPAAPSTIVTLKVPTTSDSIMATTEGTSELVSQQWAKLHDQYARVPASRSAAQVRPGPGRLPLALPRFRSLAGAGDLINAAKDVPQQALLAWDAAGLPADAQLDHCWLYVLKGINSGRPYPTRVIAQGTLEARSAAAPFALLGAAPGDTLLLLAERRDQPPVVLSAVVGASGRPDWRAAAPPMFPAIDVVPEPVAPNEPRARVRVRLTYPGQAAQGDLPEQVCVFPLGQAPDFQIAPLDGPYGAAWVSAPLDVPTLDGQVLLRWKNGGMLIGAFSQGGDGPNSQSPFPANPINAGSANGEALLFMYKDHPDDQAPNDVKVVTTIAHGLTGAPQGAQARSYAFSIASNRELPGEFHPTLIMYYDQPGDEDGAAPAAGAIAICRRRPDGAWEPLPTYLPPRYRFAVAPLDQRSAAALIEADVRGPRVEHYKVCWISRA